VATEVMDFSHILACASHAIIITTKKKGNPWCVPKVALCAAYSERREKIKHYISDNACMAHVSPWVFPG